MDNRSIVILSGGLSPERDVSLRSGRRIADCLRNRDLDVEVIDVDDELAERLSALQPACAIPLVHGVAGENGDLTELISSMGLPHVGSTAESCRRAFDKPTANAVVAEQGIPVPTFVMLEQETFRARGAREVLDEVLRDMALPLVVKPAQGGSSLGVSIVRQPSELPYAMVNAFAYGDRAIVQAYIGGTEVTVGVLETGDGIRALPVVEIHPDGGIYDYDARYTAGSTEFTIPANLPADVLAACRSTAVKAHQALGLRHWSRCDLIVDEPGQAWFLESNVAPGMTETSTDPQAVAAAGLEMSAIVYELIEAAMKP
jgi:D-alanine-D-alanine ligase